MDGLRLAKDGDGSPAEITPRERAILARDARRNAMRCGLHPTTPTEETTMSKQQLILALVAGAALAAMPVRASETDAKSHPRHATADKDGEHHEPAEGTQQHKMKTCNVEAGKKQLKGDERRAFMSACLKAA
jgi:hypothetical protein